MTTENGRTVVADLHVHTTNSDGELPLEAVPAAARRAGLDAVAVTDHDRPHPDLDAPVTTVDGVTVVHGIELRVEVGEDRVPAGGARAGPQAGPEARPQTGPEARSQAGPPIGQRVDLLGYGLDPTPDLVAECERIQRDRVDRGERIVERVESRLGIELDLEVGRGTGRPHVARAVADHPDLDFDVQDAFDELIGDGGPCYVARDVPSFERGRQLLADACQLVGLAHPLRYDDPETTLSLAADLDAVELWYPYQRPVDPADSPDVDPVERAIDRYDLVPTGGSDAHGRTLGTAGLDASAWDRVRRSIGP